MMVKNQTGAAVFTGGTNVLPDGEFHQVKDDEGTRELIRSGVLTKQEASASKTKGGDDK
jgi:hypothetical protein